MTKTATRDANTIKRLAEEMLQRVEDRSTTHFFLETRLAEIIELAGGLDASTGRRDSSTKSRRSRAAKKSSSQAVRKSAKRKTKA